MPMVVSCSMFFMYYADVWLSACFDFVNWVPPRGFGSNIFSWNIFFWDVELPEIWGVVMGMDFIIFFYIRIIARVLAGCGVARSEVGTVWYTDV